MSVVLTCCCDNGITEGRWLNAQVSMVLSPRPLDVQAIQNQIEQNGAYAPVSKVVNGFSTHYAIDRFSITGTVYGGTHNTVEDRRYQVPTGYRFDTRYVGGQPVNKETEDNNWEGNQSSYRWQMRQLDFASLIGPVTRQLLELTETRFSYRWANPVADVVYTWEKLQPVDYIALLGFAEGYANTVGDAGQRQLYQVNAAEFIPVYLTFPSEWDANPNAVSGLIVTPKATLSTQEDFDASPLSIPSVPFRAWDGQWQLVGTAPRSPQVRQSMNTAFEIHAPYPFSQLPPLWANGSSLAGSVIAPGAWQKEGAVWKAFPSTNGIEVQALRTCWKIPRQLDCPLTREIYKVASGGDFTVSEPICGMTQFAAGVHVFGPATSGVLGIGWNVANNFVQSNALPLARDGEVIPSCC